VSSTYYRLSTPPEYKEPIKLVIYPPEVAFINILVKTSMTRLNSKGERGPPLPQAFTRLEIGADLLIHLN
jgi:hypothetical protein